MSGCALCSLAERCSHDADVLQPPASHESTTRGQSLGRSQNQMLVARIASHRISACSVDTLHSSCQPAMERRGLQWVAGYSIGGVSPHLRGIWCGMCGWVYLPCPAERGDAWDLLLVTGSGRAAAVGLQAMGMSGMSWYRVLCTDGGEDALHRNSSSSTVRTPSYTVVAVELRSPGGMHDVPGAR